MSKPLTVVCLHFLGGSANEFGDMASRLKGTYTTVAIDLPGFGTARDLHGYSVTDMATSVMAEIRLAAMGDWMLVGHSMGAKVAALVARQAEDGAEGLSGLVGLVSLAGSPPGPEPMEESKRKTMLGWFRGGAEASRREAESYIADNVSAPLPARLAQLAVADALRAHPEAWRAWLNGGSRENLSERIGKLRTSTLIVAGGDDKALGESAQRRFALPHYANVRLHTLKRTGHLLPLERAEEVVELIRGHGEAHERRL